MHSRLTIALPLCLMALAGYMAPPSALGLRWDADRFGT